jgi:hypothetical protein
MYNSRIIKSAIKAALQKGEWLRYHYVHKLLAEEALKSIESEKGKLDPKIKKQAREYARDILGWTGFAPWLNVYSAIAGKFKEGWIPDNYYGKIVVPRLKGLYGEISEVKPLSSKLLNTDRLPDIAYYVNGLFFSPTWEALPAESVEKYIFAHDDRIVYKEDKSLQGKGIHFFTSKTFNMRDLQMEGGKGGVFQKYIEQHPFFDEIMPNSVATLRITSVIEDNGKASCRAAYLRIGRSKDTHVKSASAIKIPVDLISGRLQEKGYLPNWCSINCHPDTHVTFEGKKIPKFNECISLIINIHRANPYCRSIGWDITVDKNEKIQLIEWNGSHNDIKFSEATQGPCFADMGWENIYKINK